MAVIHALQQIGSLAAGMVVGAAALYGIVWIGSLVWQGRLCTLQTQMNEVEIRT